MLIVTHPYMRDKIEKLDGIDHRYYSNALFVNKFFLFDCEPVHPLKPSEVLNRVLNSGMCF